MRSIKLVALSLVLVLGSGGVGYALARRPARPVAAAVEAECAVPVAAEHERHVEATLATTVRPVEVHTDERPAAPERPSITERPAPRARRLVVTHAIEDREPVDDLSVVELERGERLYAFADLSNAGGATELEVTFEHESGLTVGHVELALPAHAPRHRTWAYSTRVEEPGNWTAVIRDQDGDVLAMQTFEVR